MDSTNLEGVEIDSSVDVWRGGNTTAQEVKAKQQPIDYSQILGDARVLFLGEMHNNGAVRDHLALHAADLRAAGITHYAIEANEAGNEVLEQLSRDPHIDLSGIQVGPGGDRQSYERTIRAMAAQGIKVVAVDIDQSAKPTREEREARMTANVEKILQENPENRVAYLVGGFHTSKRIGLPEISMIGKRISDAGIKSRVVMFTGGSDAIPMNLTNAAKGAGLSETEFALDLRPYANSGSRHIPYGPGETDFVVHLPQTAVGIPKYLSGKA